MLAAWLKEHFKLVWWALFLAIAAPGMGLAWSYLQNDLGTNPLETLLRTTGQAALNLIILSLTITPLRRILSLLSKWLHFRHGKRLADWNWLVRLHRQIGLWCFAYALAHAWVFVAFDLGYQLGEAWLDIQEKPYLLVGALALLLLVPLAVTSTKGMMKRLGSNWFRLQQLIYAVAVLGLLHFWWLVKPGVWSPIPYTITIVLLLGYRLLLQIGLLEKWSGSDGLKTPDRSTGSGSTTTH